MSQLKDNLTDHEIIVHCDFSENYNLKFAEEIQSFHFGGARQQISMHTVVVYRKSSETLETKCFCTVSCSLQHNAPAIWAHLFPVMNVVVPDSIHTVHFLSDSPSGQYRNKSMFLFLANHIGNRFTGATNVTWNYQEAGAPDGIGGVCKRTADRIVAQGRDLPNIDTLVDVLQEHCLGVKIFSVSETEITKISDVIEKGKVLPFKGTLKVHQVKATNNPNRLSLRRLSCFNCSDKCGHYEIGTLTYEDSPTSGLDSEEELGMISSYSSSQIQYEDVYTDTETLCTDTSENDFSSVTTGMYVLVEVLQVHTNKKKQEYSNKKYMYAALCQSRVDEDDEIKVVFLKLVSKNENVFLIDDTDVSYINTENVLPQPCLLVKGNRLYYKFPSFVEVHERQ
ncbi:uncharacterized protein LOC134537909 [Bacillus rossius redtenbacheri]|uniref:uncharacterized protein LOC134537909 n=1 Tax=Bacillus rossius redtenbacheri TaxID=93214 RepID=UPI002FDCDBCF